MPELRILSGKYKGLKLLSPDLKTTHPMGSREKLALFNMLAPYLEGATVLDYFAGSGALGLEALSRGAANVVFVENNPRARKIIKENIRRVGLVQQASGQAWQVVSSLLNNKEISPRESTALAGLSPELERSGIPAKARPSVVDSKGEIISRSEDYLRLPHFSVIISDPPYDNYQVPDYASLLNPSGILALSHPKEFDPTTITDLTLLKTSHYAACNISLFTK